MLRFFVLLLLAAPVHAAPGKEASDGIRCAALLARVTSALEAAGRGSTLTAASDAWAAHLARVTVLERSAGYARTLAETPLVTLPVSPEMARRVEDCMAVSAR